MKPLVSVMIGAYNAAMMRLERRSSGDRDAAITLLKRAVTLGDEPARKALASLTPSKVR